MLFWRWKDKKEDYYKNRNVLTLFLSDKKGSLSFTETFPLDIFHPLLGCVTKETHTCRVSASSISTLRHASVSTIRAKTLKGVLSSLST